MTCRRASKTIGNRATTAPQDPSQDNLAEWSTALSAGLQFVEVRHCLELKFRPVKQKRYYTWPGSSWRPSACEADVIATRPQVRMHALSTDR